ncbi:hypothetical protein Hanom_Chr11g01013501 [Helianthus anomalus]
MGMSSEMDGVVSMSDVPPPVVVRKDVVESEGFALELDGANDQHWKSNSASHANSRAIPRNEELVRNQSFNARSALGVNNIKNNSIEVAEKPFTNNWVNLVGQASPRPKKRRRHEDLFSLEGHLGLVDPDPELAQRSDADAIPNHTDRPLTLNIVLVVSVSQSYGTPTSKSVLMPL